MIDYQILSDQPNGLSSRSVWVMLRSNTVVRKTELVIANHETPAPMIEQRLTELWQAAEAVPDGMRSWYIAMQNQSDAFLNNLIFAVFVQVQAGADLPTILAAANMTLDENPLQKDIYKSLALALQGASESQVRQFTALALTVAFGKLGQR